MTKKSRRANTSRKLAGSTVTNVVVDLSHHNADPDFAVARDRGGIVGEGAIASLRRLWNAAP